MKLPLCHTKLSSFVPTTFQGPSDRCQRSSIFLRSRHEGDDGGASLFIGLIVAFNLNVTYIFTQLMKREGRLDEIGELFTLCR